MFSSSCGNTENSEGCESFVSYPINCSECASAKLSLRGEPICNVFQELRWEFLGQRIQKRARLRLARTSSVHFWWFMLWISVGNRYDREILIPISQNKTYADNNMVALKWEGNSRLQESTDLEKKDEMRDPRAEGAKDDWTRDPADLWFFKVSEANSQSQRDGVDLTDVITIKGPRQPKRQKKKK